MTHLFSRLRRSELLLAIINPWFATVFFFFFFSFSSFNLLMPVKAILYIKAPLSEISSVISVSDLSLTDTPSNPFAT